MPEVWSQKSLKLALKNTVFSCRIRGMLKTLFALLTTMFLTFPYSFITMILNFWLQPSNVSSGILMILTSAALMLAIWRFLTRDFVYMMNHLQNSDVIKFCTIPIFYSVLTYAIGKYVGGVALAPIRCFLFFNTLIVYLLLMNILKRTRDMQLLQNEKNMLALLMESSRKYMEELRVSQSQTVLYRHDIRHHLSLISSLAEDGEPCPA